MVGRIEREAIQNLQAMSDSPQRERARSDAADELLVDESVTARQSTCDEEQVQRGKESNAKLGEPIKARGRVREGDEARSVAM